MPNRLLREGIISSERVDQLDWPAEVFYRRLMSVVDDFGRFDGRPKVILAACYPLKAGHVREADIQRWIAACVKAGLVRLYSVDKRSYLLLVDFRQLIRAKKSKYPDPPECSADAVQTLDTCTAHALEDEGVVEDGDEGEDGPQAAEFMAAWNALGPPFQRIAKWTDARQTAFRARVADKFFRENWKLALEKVQRSSFCRGESGHGTWVADADFFLSQRGFVRIVEGKYDDKEQSDPNDAAAEAIGAKLRSERNGNR